MDLHPGPSNVVWHHGAGTAPRAAGSGQCGAQRARGRCACGTESAAAGRPSSAAPPTCLLIGVGDAPQGLRTEYSADTGRKRVGAAPTRRVAHPDRAPERALMRLSQLRAGPRLAERVGVLVTQGGAGGQACGWCSKGALERMHTRRMGVFLPCARRGRVAAGRAGAARRVALCLCVICDQIDLHTTNPCLPVRMRLRLIRHCTGATSAPAAALPHTCAKRRLFVKTRNPRQRECQWLRPWVFTHISDRHIQKPSQFS